MSEVTTSWRVAVAVIHHQLNMPHNRVPDIARATGLAPATVYRWREKPPENRPSVDTVVRLGAYFHMVVSFTFQEVQNAG